MAMLKVCGHPGCATLTLGALCLEHEQLPAGRGDRRRARAVPAVVGVSRTVRRVADADGRRPGV
jgi:hypothetical protein